MGENGYMSREEHIGREWSGSFFVNRETRKVFRYIDKRRGEAIKGVGSFVGRLLDVDNGGEVGNVRAGWLSNGDIEVIFPAMGAGRYVIVIDHVGQNGEVRRFLNGYAGYLEPGYVMKSISEGDESVIVVCASEDEREVYALAGSAVDYSAKDAIDAADRAEAAKNEAREQLAACIAFMNSFNDALKEAIQIRENYVWIAGQKTDSYIKGEDGLTPRYGADGNWYIGDKLVGKARGDDGITPHITADGYWAIGSMKTSVRAAGRDGVNGASMRRVLIPSVADLPSQKELGIYYYVKIGEKLYDVYVWLENANGWVNVKETNDIATDEVHGLVKFTAGEQEEGAPVGWKKGDDGLPTGEAIVPLAGTAVAGTGKLGSAVVIEFGAPVGMNSDAAYYVPAASVSEYGTIKLGTATTITDGAVVGINGNGQALVPYATLTAAGCIKLGSQYGENNREPYIVGIGATKDKTLANNYLVRGALQHRRPSSWQGSMDWLDVAMNAESEYFVDAFYTGLLTTIQFTQTELTGLELNPATTELLAGVYLATSMTDTRSAAVVQPAMVVNYLSEHYYGKSQIFTKQETQSEIIKKLETYASITWLQDNYMSRTEIMAELQRKIGCPSARISNIDIMTNSERTELSHIDEKQLYLIYA